MKIAVIGAKGLPPKQGGIEHYCAEVYPRMVARGCDVDLFARASYNENRWFEAYDFDGVRVIPLPSLPKRGIDAFFGSALGTVAASGTQYDIVHFHALGPALFSSLTKFLGNSKIVVTCQGLDWQRAKWGNVSSRVIQAGEKAAVRFADEMIVVSEALQSYFCTTYGRKTVYIPNAPASYPKSDADFTYGKKLGLIEGHYILFVGRIVPEKRPDLLIEAFVKLNKPGWKLVFAGGVSDTKDYVSSLLAKVANSPKVVFAGELRGARLAEIVRGAGLFVLPSDLEGLPLAMLEAMSEGIPVLASDIPPHQQLLANDRGVLFSAGNVDALEQKLAWAFEHPVELLKMAELAQRHVKRYYSWERITSENLEVYQRLLKPNQLVGESEPNLGRFVVK